MTNNGMTDGEPMLNAARSPCALCLSHSSLGTPPSAVHWAIAIREVPLALLLAFAVASAQAGQPSVQLRDVTKGTGIQFVHTDGNCGRRYIVETVSAGLAVFD